MKNNLLLFVLLGVVCFWSLPQEGFSYVVDLDSLPDYYILGCQKCGTTSIHDYITKQKGYCYLKEENHAFKGDHCLSPYDYNLIFEHKTHKHRECLKFDNTPENFYYRCFYNYLEVTNNFNILVVLRDPIERFVSSLNMVIDKYNHYNYHKLNNKIESVNNSLIEAYLAESYRPEGITARVKSCFDPIIPRIIHACKRHHCTFLDFSELVGSRKVLNEVFDLQDEKFVHSNQHKKYVTVEDLSEKVKDYLRSCNLLYYSWRKSDHSTIHDFFQSDFDENIDYIVAKIQGFQ